MAAELVGKSVVVGSVLNATHALYAAISTIRIVFVIANDPVAVGLVANLNRYGGNVTGVSYLNSDLGGNAYGV